MDRKNMKAEAIIDRIRRAGGRIRAHGADLLLSAARPLSSELVAEVRQHKGEIFNALQIDKSCGEDVHALAIEFETTGRIRIESDWAGPVWLVASGKQLRGNEDGSVYFPSEIPFLVELSPQERQQLHGFKRCFGGTFEIKRQD